MMHARLFGLVVLLFLTPSLVHAQQADSIASISEACADSPYRAFDFWIGRWVVRDSTGDQVGTSQITPIAKGCGIREEWAGHSGSRGTSLNYYDEAEDVWHQDWVGSDGLILHLTGRRNGRTMVLEGERMGEDGSVRDRIRWRPLDDGRVRQEWTMSSDGGETWERVFLGFYEAAQEEGEP